MRAIRGVLLALAVGAALTLAGCSHPAGTGRTATDLGSGSSSADVTSYATRSVRPPADALLLLVAVSARADGTASAPVSVSGLGAGWSRVAVAHNPNVTLTEAVFSTTTATTAGAVRVTYAGAQQGFTWRLVKVGRAVDTVVQSTTAYAATATVEARLAAAPQPGSAVAGFAATLSTTQSLSAGSGFTSVGSQPTATAPALRSSAEWAPRARVTVPVTGSGAASKVLVAVEVSDGPYTRPPVTGPTVAVIGDSLTYQDGAGAAAIERRLAAIGYDARHAYVDGVGGKTMTTPDSTGVTTLENIADARAELGHVDTWIIALGTNDVTDSDATFVADQQAVLHALGRHARVVWVGLAFHSADNSRAAHFNPLLAAGLAHWPHARFADWDAYIHDGRDETGLWVYPTDSTHMTPAGYAVRDAYYASLVPRVSGSRSS